MSTESTTSPNSGPKRVWAPFAWLGFVAVVYGCVLLATDVQDRRNSAAYVSVYAALFGICFWIFRSSGLSLGKRWAAVLTLLLPAAAFAMGYMPFEVVHDANLGITGLRWRWAEPDRELGNSISASRDEPDAAAWEPADTDYPRFLGNGYWAEVKGVQLDYDKLAKQPPTELWRNRIGAGWSGFAVVGSRAITQEQRGDEELVTCYDLQTGDLVWLHADSVRWDPTGAGSLGYEGPRATPTIAGDRVYAQGATGILNCLELRTGKLIWSHDTLAENKATNVVWGKSGSPLVVDDMVVLSVGGTDGDSLIAYDAATGDRRWASGDARSSYATPVLATLAGVRQILSVDEGLVRSVDPEDGRQLWTFPWDSQSDGAAATTQPMPLGDDRVFLSKGYGHGATVLKIARDENDQWQVNSAWQGGKDGLLPVMKTKMSNVVVHQKMVYGLDDAMLECADLKTGRKRWKKRRQPNIGHGQLLLVDGVLLILSESGEVVFVEATPERYHEMASFPAIEGVTWNNPVLVGSMLLVRNAQEAACFELPLRSPAPQ